MVIEVDQLSLMMRIIHVGVLFKTIHHFICTGKELV